MRIPPTTAGALRLLVSIAVWLREHPGSVTAPFDEAARAAGLSGPEVSRVADALECAGYLARADGKPPAFRLLGSPGEIALGEVAKALERPLPPPPVTCDSRLAHLERTLAWAMHEVERFLGQYTLDQMLPGPREPEPCAAPRAVGRGRAHLRLLRS